MPKFGVAVVAIAVLAACGSPDDEPLDGRPAVVAAFYPVFEAATQVAGDAARVTNLTPAGTEPHDLELSSRQVDRLEDAAVVLYFGRSFQPAVEKALARAKGSKVDLLADTDALLAPATASEEDEHGHAGGHLDVDPHVWLDPSLLRGITGRIRSALSELDPAKAAMYEANAAAYGRALDDLDAAFREGLAQCDRRVIVTSHAAFGYLARRYGLTQEPIAGLSPESEPDPRRMAELAAKVRAEGITTIFYETLVSPKVAESLAREAGVRTAVLDPLEGLAEKEIERGATYASVMRDNLDALRRALGCR